MLLASLALNMTFLLSTVLPYVGMWFSSPMLKHPLKLQYLMGGWLWVAEHPTFVTHLVMSEA